jgi:hypothetical protein
MVDTKPKSVDSLMGEGGGVVLARLQRFIADVWPNGSPA